ncbi:WASH complex subunit 2 isoform X3 [Takifugu rubripes]|uniref:WASH complex subunit 2 isoform X3 n=1 Tax=Takifugu rubripes TaxID=31033 RepID=UPI0011459A2C|nr:WASH complex subunit 2 isoform X3 [Takifugu rubripes]
MSGLSEGITNGPSSQKDAQMWERPWTLEEMRQNSANWSLAADSGLFLSLQDFSQRMLSKTHEIEKQLDSLIRDTKATDSRLHSVFNDFLMLSNTQFIENRVYDEEVEENIPKTDGPEKQPEQEKTREQKEAELIPKMQEAVNYGLKVLESAFEHLDIKAGNSDSEDEEVTDKVEAILEPKDLYVDRPLPYLIGSRTFMEQDDVGLGDLSSDEVSVDSDRDSVLESEDGKEVTQSDEDLDQEEEISHNNIKKKSSMVSYDEEDEDSDIFGESDRDDDDDNEDDNTENTRSSSFAKELAARIKGDAAIKAEGDRASLASKKKSKGRKEPKPSKPQADEDDDDMFKPPKMDDNDDDFSPFGGKGGLFSGGRGLFDDDDEGDLFAEAPKPPASEDKNLLNESVKSTAQAAESDKPGKKIPAGGISVFPGNDSDSVGSKENGTPAPPRPHPPGAGFAGGGLFEDDEDDDDFFGGSSTKKSDSAGPAKTKTPIDLFADDDEDGDIFSEKFSAPAQSKKDIAAESGQHPEKKMPAGAISMFGPGTKSLLREGLKKRRPSTSEESEKSEENGPTPSVGKAAVKLPQKPQTRGLFSDDEDTQGFPAIPKSLSKPEPTSQGKTSKAASLLFDDEEEEDLFATAVKSNPKSNQAKASTPQPTKAVSSSLFSDDEDQWMTSKSSAGKPEVNSGGMKPSASAPSSLPSAKSSHSSLFVDADDEDDDDLFSPKQESSQKVAQRVSLLFEDEDDEYNGSLFGIKSAVNKNAAPPAHTPAVSSQTSSPVDKSEKIAASWAPEEERPSEHNEPTTKTAKTVPSSPLSESGGSKKKPVGGVSLFGGIDVVGSKQTKLLDEVDDGDGFLGRDSPPLNVKKEDKFTRNTFSLFDDDEEDESDWNEPKFTPSKPNTKTAVKPAEEQPQAKSTGVFQDEELLFSQTQQRDNDPDVDLFATSGKAASSKVSLAKPAAQSLFADEDEEDDLFSSVKPTPPPKVSDKPHKPDSSGSSVDSLPQKLPSSPVKAKESSTRIGKLQASLTINPAALLPGAAPGRPGAVGLLPGTASKSSSGVLSSVFPPVGAQTGSEQGVSFDAPVQVSTLPSAHKTRAKISAQRRPQSRAARQQAAKISAAKENAVLPISQPSGFVLSSEDKSSRAVSTDLPAAPDSSLSKVTPPPLTLTLPGTKNAGIDESSKGSNSTNVLQTSEDDLFASDGLFGSTSAIDAPPTRQTVKTTQAVGDAGQKKDKDSSTFPSIFEDNSVDLFQTSKPRLTNKKAKAASFLEEDEDEDIFRVSNASTPTSTSSKEFKNSSSYSKLDIFQDEVTAVPKVQKKHKKATDANLFDDNVDIFADLTDTVKPKQKSKTKGEPKSIFDDDMDDIFSSSTIKPVTKVSSKAKKTNTAADSSSIFDDPLNAGGGN